ncbi:MAG: hypothetical protein LBI89_04220, partial [Prevotellaceae bacterium]|nr:hypothetical protein [Prevotellaceae bacterium]
TPLATDYAGKKVTFRVTWDAAPYNNNVWVWVDLCPVAGVSPGTFAQAVIGAASATAGSIATVAGNQRGFYVTANPSTVTATLTNAAGAFSWCAYASDYPPNVTVNDGTYTFKGTPPFRLIAPDGTTQTVTGKTLAASALTVTPLTMTDETGYPGVLCAYAGSDLYIDATHLCQQRTVGAGNWEAHIKDSRDNQIYRITQFSDNSWWMADNMANAAKMLGTCDGYTYYRGSNKPACPAGWLLPTNAEVNDRYSGDLDDWGAPMTFANTLWSVLYDRCISDAESHYWILSDVRNSLIKRKGGGWLWSWDDLCYCTGNPNGDGYNMGAVRCRRSL